MQALAERLAVAIGGAAVEGVDPLGFAVLKTVVPSPESVVGPPRDRRRPPGEVPDLRPRRRQPDPHPPLAGRPARHRGAAEEDAPKGAAVRIRFDNGRALLVREHGHERKAAWWVLAADDDGPLEKLGPEPDSDEFAELVLHGTDKRRIHTILRDQRTVSGIGRGYANDALAPRGRLAVRDARLVDRRGAARACSTRSGRRSPRHSTVNGSGPADCPNRSSAHGSGSTTGRAPRAPSAVTACAASRTSPTR